MTKEDLSCGNVVETRMGKKYLYTEDKNHNTMIVNLDDTEFDLDLDQYHNDLTYNHDSRTHHYFDIIKVYKDYTLKELLWERKECPKLIEIERTILENIDKEYKWIARDNDGFLGIYRKKPSKNYNLRWEYGRGAYFYFTHLFQFIKWEDDEPYKIEDLLKRE